MPSENGGLTPHVLPKTLNTTLFQTAGLMQLCWLAIFPSFYELLISHFHWTYIPLNWIRVWYLETSIHHHAINLNFLCFLKLTITNDNLTNATMKAISNTSIPRISPFMTNLKSSLKESEYEVKTKNSMPFPPSFIPCNGWRIFVFQLTKDKWLWIRYRYKFHFEKSISSSFCSTSILTYSFHCLYRLCS